jgi:hypothetical protein
VRYRVAACTIIIITTAHHHHHHFVPQLISFYRRHITPPFRPIAAGWRQQRLPLAAAVAGRYATANIIAVAFIIFSCHYHFLLLLAGCCKPAFAGGMIIADIYH